MCLIGTQSAVLPHTTGKNAGRSVNIAVMVNGQGQGHMVPEFNIFRGSP